MAIIADRQEAKGGNNEVMLHMVAALASHDINTMYVSADKLLPSCLRKWEQIFRIWSLRNISKTDVSKFDMIITMQPDSHCIRHPNHIVYFQHHLKQYYDLFWQTFRSKKGIKRKIIFLLLTAIARFADRLYLTPNLRNSHVIVNSETVGKRLVKYNEISNFSVIRPGCKIIAPSTPAAEDEKLGLPANEKNDPPVALSFSRLNVMQKGIDVILETAALTSSYSFIIAGPSDPTIGGIDHSRLPANVRIIEKEFSDEEKAELFANCDVFLAPYVEEDFGITPIEANAYGKPVVYCDDSGGVKYTQRHMETGFMCKRNPEDIAIGIDYCIRNANRMLTMCTANAAKYSWSAFESAFRAYVEDHA